MWIPCETYYENYLGDCCSGKCDNCPGDKEIYECTEDFEVSGETVLDTVKIKKGQWFWIQFINEDHVLLNDGDGLLRLKRDLFEKFFTDRFIVETTKW